LIKKEFSTRVLVLVKADRTTEAGQLPSTEMLTEMNAFNEQLVNAGVMQMGENLHSSSKGKRVRFSGTNPAVDGPQEERLRASAAANL
jgi:hypothetical protein